MRERLLLLCTLALATGCTKPERDGYPSLLPRPIESADVAEPMREPDAARPDPALDQEIARLSAALGTAEAAFSAQADRAEQLARAARGAAAGSDPWIAAQVALGELDVLRATTNGLVADVERLTIERAASGAPAYPALETLYAAATTRAAAERARVSAIEAVLAPA